MTKEIFDQKTGIDADLLAHETAITRRRTRALDNCTDESLREILQFTIARKSRQIKASAASVDLPPIVRPRMTAKPVVRTAPLSGAGVVIFQPMNRQITVSANTTLLANALKAGIPIRHDCGGKGQCGTCRVKVVNGGNNLTPFTPPEQKLLAILLNQSWRLACQVKARGPVAVNVPPSTK